MIGVSRSSRLSLQDLSEADDTALLSAQFRDLPLARLGSLLEGKLGRTGVHAYTVDQLLRQMIARAQSLGLHVIDAPDVTTEKLLVLLTMQRTTVVHVGFPKVAL